MNNKYIIEFKQLIKIGVPIFGSQMSYMLMGATDVIVAGRASANDLAGLALGTAFGNAIWFFISGVIFSVTPIIAQLYGAKKFIDVGTQIKKGQTVMIVEAMKTMNHIPSTNDGVVKEVLVKDGQPVEFGQSLVLLK